MSTEREEELAGQVAALREALEYTHSDAIGLHALLDLDEGGATSHELRRIRIIRDRSGRVLADTGPAAREHDARIRAEVYDRAFRHGRDYEALDTLSAMKAVDEYDKLRSAAIRERGE